MCGCCAVAVSVHAPPARDAYNEYYKSLQGLKKISLVTDLETVCNWSLGFCALTWASAVLLGAYIADLQVWDFYDVSVLLFVEGLRFGVAALIRMLGIYRIPKFLRLVLRSAQLFIPLWMGGFALLSILPVRIRDNIADSFFISRIEESPALNTTAHITAVAGSHHAHLPYKSLSASLTIFYSLILANAVVLLVGNTITGTMRKIYVHSHAKSLYYYHDKLLLESSSWMQAGIDLHYAFKMLSFEYKREKKADRICKDYVDLIGFLYMHEKGVEAAEMALEADDMYVREAAAHMVGFWAVWEKVMEEVWPEEAKKSRKQVPLRYQGQLLSLLVDVAAERYGATSSAAACSLGLLMEVNRKENVQGMLTVLKRKEKKLATMLLQRAEDVLKAPADSALRELMRRNSRWHMYALEQLVAGLSPWSNREELEAKLGNAAQPSEMKELAAQLAESWEGGAEQLCKGLSEGKNDLETLENIMKEKKEEARWWRNLKTALFVLFNVAVPLTLGFLAKALINRRY